MDGLAAISKKLKKLNNVKLQQMLEAEQEQEQSEEEEEQQEPDSDYIEVDMNEAEGQSAKFPNVKRKTKIMKTKPNSSLSKNKMAMIKKMLQAASECMKTYRKITELEQGVIYNLEGYQTRRTTFGKQPGTSHVCLLTNPNPYTSDWYYLPQATVKRYKKILNLLADKDYFKLFNFHLVYKGMRAINKEAWQMHDVHITMEQVSQ